MEKEHKTRKIGTVQLAAMGLMTAVMCILGPLSIPLPGGVPISLNGFAIFLTAYLLGWKKGAVSYLLYLLLGIIGLPVFSGYGAGLAKVAGPTGGYLVGFIFMAMIAGAFAENKKKNIWIAVVGMALGSATDLAFGTAWYMFVTNTPLVPALTACVIPFLPGNAVKIALTAIVGKAVELRLNKAGIRLR